MKKENSLLKDSIHFSKNIIETDERSIEEMIKTVSAIIDNEREKRIKAKEEAKEKAKEEAEAEAEAKAEEAKKKDEEKKSWWNSLSSDYNLPSKEKRMEKVVFSSLTEQYYDKDGTLGKFVPLSNGDKPFEIRTTITPIYDEEETRVKITAYKIVDGKNEGEMEFDKKALENKEDTANNITSVFKFANTDENKKAIDKLLNDLGIAVRDLDGIVKKI